MTYYLENQACKDSLRTPADILQTLTIAERKAFYLMSAEEVKYLKEECDIQNYVEHLRRGKLQKALGEEFPILVVKGTSLQLERFKIVFLLSLIDYQGVNYYYPSDFSLGDESFFSLASFSLLKSANLLL